VHEIETRRWDIAEHPDSDEAIAAYLTIVFQDGDAAGTRDALNMLPAPKKRWERVAIRSLIRCLA